MSDNYKENSIVAIENGHVSNRKVGDGPSLAVLDALKSDPQKLEDHASYLTKTKDGRILKSTTIYIRNDEQKIIGVFSINYDITELIMIENAIKPLVSVESEEKGQPDSTKRHRPPQRPHRRIDAASRKTGTAHDPRR